MRRSHKRFSRRLIDAAQGGRQRHRQRKAAVFARADAHCVLGQAPHLNRGAARVINTSQGRGVYGQCIGRLLASVNSEIALKNHIPSIFHGVYFLIVLERVNGVYQQLWSG